MTRIDQEGAFRELVALLERLRAPDGCPWDREQTHVSLKRYLLEETHEVLEAIDQQAPHKLVEELGDVAWYFVSLCRAHNINPLDVFQKNADKLRKRYPDGFVEGEGNRD